MHNLRSFGRDALLADIPTDSLPGEDTEFDEVIQEDGKTPPKYEITDITKEYEGHTLYRIKAIRDFGNIREGHMGGWVENQYNLTHEGACWIYDEAIVMGDAQVRDDAQIRDEAIICDSADVTKRARILDQAYVCHDAIITDQAMLRDNAVVCLGSAVMGHSLILNNAFVKNAVVDDHVCVQDNALVIGANLTDHAYLCDNAVVDSEVTIGGYSRLDKQSKLIQSKDEKWTAPFIRCSLFDIETYLSEYEHPENVLDEIEGIAHAEVDENDPNLYHVKVYPGVFLNINPDTVDPRAKASITYVGVPIDDAPRMHWPEEMIGQEDELTITVTHDLFRGFRRHFTLHVTIVEKPEELEEPPEEISLDLAGIVNYIDDDASNAVAAEATELPHSYTYKGYVNENLHIVPILADERATWTLTWYGIDISNINLKIIDKLENAQFELRVIDPDNPERYETNIVLVSIEAAHRPSLAVQTIECGVEGAKITRRTDDPSVFDIYLTKPSPVRIQPVLDDSEAEWSIYWMGVDVSDGPVDIPYACDDEEFIIIVKDPDRVSRRKEYKVYLTQGGEA